MRIGRGAPQEEAPAGPRARTQQSAQPLGHDPSAQAGAFDDIEAAEQFGMGLDRFQGVAKRNDPDVLRRHSEMAQIGAQVRRALAPAQVEVARDAARRGAQPALQRPVEPVEARQKRSVVRGGQRTPEQSDERRVAVERLMDLRGRIAQRQADAVPPRSLSCS